MFPKTYYGITYFGGSYYGGAGASLSTITSTRKIQLPINCILAGQQHYKQSGRTYEIRPKNTTELGGWKRTKVARLKGSKPSFTIRTDNRGYD